MAMKTRRPDKVGARTGRRVIGNASVKKNNTNAAAKNQADTGHRATFEPQPIVKAALVSGFGQHHTANPDKENPRPYVTITLEQIMAMAANPSSVAKDKAQWVIPSTTGGAEARGHAYQRENGTFYTLWVDADDVEGLTWADVVERAKTTLPGFMVILYTSRSATENKPKSRLIVPLAEGIPGRDYSMMAKILNDRLDAAGLIPDRATERTGQLCYLPNRGEYYQHIIINGDLLNPSGVFADEIQAEQARLEVEAEERNRRHLEALRKTQARINSGQADPIAAFNAEYPVELALEMNGHTQQRDGRWLPPGSESGKAGGTVKDGKVHFFNSCMSGFGKPSNSGGTWGDGFDLEVFHRHGSDRDRALRAVGDMFYTTDPVTGERITITQFNQRQHMRNQDTGVDPETDFQGTGNQGSTGNQNGPDPWESIVPLESETAPPMDPEILPGTLRNIVVEVARATETPPELATGMGLSVVAICCQGKMRTEPRTGYREPLNLFTVTALDSANRKTGVTNTMTEPLRAAELEMWAKAEPFIKEMASRQKNIESRLKSLRAKYGKAKPDELREIENEIQEMERQVEPVPPLPRLWADDVTPEHLGTMMHQQNERMGILSAEGGIFDILAGRYSNGIPNMEIFLKGHACEPGRVDRGSREPVFLDAPSLTIGLAPQPAVLQGLTGKPGFRGRGLLARFLYFLPASRLGYRTLKTDPVPEHVKQAWGNLITRLLSIEPRLDEHNREIPYIIKLSSEALKEWEDFSQAVEVEMRPGGRFEPIKDWAGKLPGAAARIAGLFHCIENPGTPWADPVTGETMTQALNLSAVYADHALVAFGLMGGDPALEGAKKVWRWIETGRHRQFKKRDCFQALRGTFTRVKEIEEPMNVLIERNYIRAEVIKTGGRPTELVTVNPEIVRGWA
jgi:hypothetical protein